MKINAKQGLISLRVKPLDANRIQIVAMDTISGVTYVHVMKIRERNFFDEVFNQSIIDMSQVELDDVDADINAKFDEEGEVDAYDKDSSGE